LASVLVAVPVLEEPSRTAVEEALEASGVWDRHERRDVVVASLPDMRGIEAKTMGRTIDDDPVFFRAAAAAGSLAARVAEERQA
ncbi:MAG: DUF3866 family protein, partial [Coriobacteriia bacterium]|nr:DUF3866 family protein [Coriobacteriia bacterium]